MSNFHDWAADNKLIGDGLTYPKGDFRRVLVFIDHLCHRILLTIAQLAVIAMLCIVFFNVILRFCFNTGIAWVEEIPRLLVILFTFIACSIGVRDHMHISVTILYSRFKKDGKMRKFMDILADLSTLICGFILFYYGIQFLISLRPGWLPMTGLPTWLQYVPAPICGFIMIVDSLLFLTGVLKPDDLLFSEPEVDYEEIVKEQKASAEGGKK